MCRVALLLFSVLVVVFSQALDFHSAAARTVGDSFWLEDGEWSVDITGRTDLVSSVIELSLGVSHPGYPCYYSVWGDETQLTHGTFENVANNIIPLLTGTVDASSVSMLTVKTNGCVLGRYAVPFAFGDSSGSNVQGSVELVDVSPTSPLLASFYASNNAGYNEVPLTIPDNFNDWVSRLLYVQTSDLDCQFSSQACDGAPNEQFWVSPVGGNGPFNWPVKFSSNSSDELVVELSSWSANPLFTNLYLCNSSAPSTNCSDFSGPGFTEVGGYSDTPSFYSEGPAASGLSSLKYSRVFIEFPQDSVYAPVLVLTSENQVVNFPYAKVWDLSVTADPLHQISKLDLTGSDCKSHQYDNNCNCAGSPATTGFCSDGSLFYGFDYDTNASPSFEGPTPSLVYDCSFSQENWYFCTKNSYVFVAQGANSTTAVDALQTTTGKTPGTTVAATIETTFPGLGFTDGFFQMYGIDAGLPSFVSQSVYLGTNNPAPALGSYYDISVKTGTGSLAQTASFWDFFIQNPSATQYLRGIGSVIGGNIESGLEAGFTVSISSKVGYSMSFQPYVFIHALPATSNISDGTPLCDPATTCSGHGSCLNGLCSCDPGFDGADCSGLVVFCQTGSCFNGGACSENPNRSYDATSEMYINTISCDCSGTNVTGSTGPFLGTYCEIPPPCDQLPCLNGGVCSVNAETNSWQCDCSGTKSPNSTQPYTGDHCEISQALPCDNSPCLNGGSCANNGVGNSAYATCDCAPTGGYIGTFCDLPPIDKCTATTCGLYGVCYPSSSAADGFTRCVCTNGWSGKTCSNEPSVCQNKCQNGGQCYTLGALSGSASQAYSCICTPPWVGMHCQWNETQWNSASSSSVGILVFLVVALSALF